MLLAFSQFQYTKKISLIYFHKHDKKMTAMKKAHVSWHHKDLL